MLLLFYCCIGRMPVGMRHLSNGTSVTAKRREKAGSTVYMGGRYLLLPQSPTDPPTACAAGPFFAVVLLYRGLGTGCALMSLPPQQPCHDSRHAGDGARAAGCRGW